jgi:hypothetical protein
MLYLVLLITYLLCHDRCMEKSHKLPFISSTSVSSSPLELMHSDLWCPSPIISRNDFRYYVIFVDDFIKFSWIYFLTTKDELSRVFISFKSQVKNLLNTTIKTLRTDGGTEFKPLIIFFHK